MLSNNSKLDHYAWITHYRLNLASKWGMYRECNGYPSACLGHEQAYVGRQSAIGQGKWRGQCEENTDFGSWYSLPSMAFCHSGETIDINRNCSWQIIETVKTIDGACLAEKPGFTAACLSIPKNGIAAAKQIFAQAFASHDKSDGGCPPLPTA